MPATRLQIKNALQSPYDRVLFAKEVLKPVFGSGFNLLNTMIEATEKPNLSESKVIDHVKIYANIKLEDDTEITCYEIVLQPTVRIERSKVIIQRFIRKLLTAGQAALVNFITPIDNSIWRLTLIAKDSILTHDGIEERYTHAKRYTYLVGPSENCKTVSEQLETLSFGKEINLDALINAFSVEKLNKAFYKDITEQFYQLIGATTGKGKNIKIYNRALQLPRIGDENDRTYQEFAVRLIGRTVFCWFLKVKKSEARISLLPEHLLSSLSVKQNPNYYHTILEKLFFQTLNTPIENRIKGLPKGCEFIPFLNGGLFEAQTDDFYKFSEATSLNNNIDTLIIPDQWFIDFFEKLEQYNFTIDENSVSDVEVSVDPEMLGSIFENLLAEIDPDSGETARKATGSFYTPREIVDYMSTESLVYYLHNDTNVSKQRLGSIFRIDGDLDLTTTETESILEALDKLKILDPACGSGAFPMGILQKILLALQKLDKKAEWWVNKQVAKNTDPILMATVKEKLQKNPDYARKIGIIQNTLYGVDIQPIAAEISKLRCFLTLIVDEHIDESKPNRGVEPLPNLEFKFVTADTLLKLPDETTQIPMYNSKKKKNPLELLSEIQEVRFGYLQSFGQEKLLLKEKFHQLQKEIFDQQGLFGSVENNRAYKIANWDPFSHEKTDWFDSEWMFGIKKFDIIIGNPPYGSSIDVESKKSLKKQFDYLIQRIPNSYLYFMGIADNLLKVGGVFSYIIPNEFLFQIYMEKARKYFLENATIEIAVNAGQEVFKAVVPSSIVLIRKEKTQNYMIAIKDLRGKHLNVLSNELNTKMFDLLSSEQILSAPNATFSFDIIKNQLVNSIISRCQPFSTFCDDIANGISTSCDSIYIVNEEFAIKHQFETKYLKPSIRGVHFNKYHCPVNTGEKILYIDSQYLSNDAPNIYKYLTEHKELLVNKSVEKKAGIREWHLLFRPRNQSLFKGPKIIVRQTGDKIIAAIDQTQNYYCIDSVNVIKVKNDHIEKFSFFIGLLNSQLLKFIYQEISQEKGRVLAQVKPQRIKQMPIFEGSKEQIKEITLVVDKVIEMKYRKEDTSIFEKEIDRLIYKLYQLTEFEIDVIANEAQ